MNYQPQSEVLVSPFAFNITNTYYNYYYLSQYNENSTSVGTIFRLGVYAYPQTFIVSMIKNKFSACSNNATFENNTGIKSFFSILCALYEGGLNTSFSNESQNATNETIRSIVAEFMPNDVFTKQLYRLYYNYSEICEDSGQNISTTNGSAQYLNGFYKLSYKTQESGITLSECQGSKDNPALPYFLDYLKYIVSLSYFMNIIENYTPSMMYYSIYYDMKNFNVFPVQKIPELIQNNIAVMGVYPGVIPSGLDTEKMLGYNPLGLPINYFKDNNVSELMKNGVDIASGVYNNITMFVALKNAINTYSYYNISTSGYPFSGHLSAGPEEYYDSCNGGIGLQAVEQNEINSMKNSTYTSLASYDLYPLNLYSEMNGFGNSTYYSYGPSIIEAVPKNIQVGYNKIQYGALYNNNTVAYENNETLNFTQNQTLLNLTIPVNAIKYPQNLHQLFAKLNTTYSYDMDYYGFNTYFSQPTFNITESQYQKTISVQEGNKTVQETVTCYVYYVSAKMNYNSTKTFIGSKEFSYSNSKKTYINVSTNMSVKNVFNLDKNGYATSLNYSYILYKSSSPKIKSFSNITIPSGTTFKLSTLNGTLLEEFTASYTPNTTITGSGAKNLILYAPTYVFPDIYQGISYYYPTISSYANNNQYNLTVKNYESGLHGIGFVGIVNFLVRGFLNSILYKFGYNITNTPQYQIVIGEHNAQEYYLEGCPYTKIGNVCVAPPPQYVLSANQTISQSDFNLLNPILYTQNMYYSNLESAFWVCSKVDLWKSVLSLEFPSVNSWKSCNNNYDLNGVDELYFTNMQLAFNETWKNFTPLDKIVFYKYLENESTYSNYTYYGNYGVVNQSSLLNGEFGRTGYYSTVFPPTILTQFSNSSSLPIFINGGSINMNISGAYDGLRLSECVFDMCYQTNIYPTKVYTMLNYNYYYMGNNTYEVSIYPNEYENESLLVKNHINVPAKANLMFLYSLSEFNNSNLVANFTAPSTFYVKFITTQSSEASMYYSGNTLYVQAPPFSNYILKINFGEEFLPPVLNGSFNFIILNQTLEIHSVVSKSYSSVEWLTIITIVIMLILLWKTNYFKPLIDDINHTFNKFKEEI